MIREITCTAPVNIAVVKYWGKRDNSLILPTNSSLSVTLDQADLRSTTTARLLDSDHTILADRLCLNHGSEEIIQINSRLGTCLSQLRALKRQLEEKDQGSIPTPMNSNSLPDSQRALFIVSENNFPTAAGLASSASGLAALVFTISQLYELKISATELSKIARQGSGSACRSMMGGFVAWQMGSTSDGSDSMAVQVAERSHWPDLQALICVVSAKKKGTSSTHGMDTSVQTSQLLQHRIHHVVPERMKQMESAILEKDMDRFAQLTNSDSNQFHAVCLDTHPPIFYLNDVSRAIIAVIEEANRCSHVQGGGYLAAYTFDAGPNAVILAPEKNMRMILNLILHFFPLPTSQPFGNTKNLFNLDSETPGELPLPNHFDENVSSVWPVGSITRLIHTQLGPGPQVLNVGLGEGLITLDGSAQSLHGLTH